MPKKRVGRKPKKIRHWLIQVRHDSGMTFNEISKRVGVTPQCLYWWEIGIRNPSPKMAKKVAETLNFDWTRFYEETSKESG